MKFLCIECDEQMDFEQREEPGDGTLAVVFRCRACSRRIAMLNNQFETQFVSSLGVVIGHEKVEPQPFAVMEKFLNDGETAPAESDAGPKPTQSGRVRPDWDQAAQRRLEIVPRFVRGMVKKIYTNYAEERGIQVITPAVMDQARSDLGLEGM
jgi:hypothetical protein